MATIPTQNAVPSEAPRDLKFNSGKIDEFVTSLEHEYKDRFGRCHMTIEGMRWIFDQLMARFEVDINQAIIAAGYIPMDSFQLGAEITKRNEILRDETTGEYYRWDGDLPKTVPAGSTPESAGGVGMGAWVSVGDASIRTVLREPSGASMIGVQPGGNLQQIINYVTPEQFGAIGDGVYHPLSGRFSSLSEAQETYPHVTSLDQSVDWAACQAAENYARGVSEVRCIRPANYHFGGSDYLELGISSRWTGLANANRDSASVIMTRTVPSNKPEFGQDCVVRVMDSMKASSPDEFVRGIVFDGFVLSRGVPRRSANKGMGTICFHANYGIGMQLGIVSFGAEYGVFGYCFWGSGGWLKIDSCHKGFFADASLITPEHVSPSSGAANTTFNFDVRIDVCVFGLVLNRVKYSKFSGYIEGMYVNDSLMPIYDHQNETAIAVTAIRCDSVDITQLGIEAWEGAFTYSRNSTVSINLSWTQDKILGNTTGKHSAYHSISEIMGTTDPYMLPETNNSYFYCINTGMVTLRNMTADMSDSSMFGDTFLVTTDTSSRFMMENCAIYFGSSRAIHPNNGNWKNISFINDRYFKDYLAPSNHIYIGNGISTQSTWQSKAVSAGDGRCNLDAPSGWKIIDFTAHLISSTTSQAKNYGAISVVAATDSQITIQTGVDVTGFSVQYKTMLQISK
ncbi:hypothetical protein Q4R10_20785 [Morganella morganii]